MIIKAEKLCKLEDSLYIKFMPRQINEETKNFFTNNKFYCVITSNNKKLYKSSLISNEGTFEPIIIPICLLQPKYTISFYNKKEHLICTFDRTTQNVQSEQKIALQFPNGYMRYISLIDNSEIIQNFSFIDYLKSGVKIALSIGIDFTGSNGHPLDEGTLHCIKYEDLNGYEKAAFAGGNFVGCYDYDQIYQVYGFGAIINSLNNNETSMCFNLNFSDNPDIRTIDGVLHTYRDCLKKEKITFSGPTEFAPLIKEVISRINKEDILEYHILMILTDGNNDDLQATKDILVEASLLPLSVIIIGIGNGNFDKMKELDGDTVPLTSSTGKKRMRDIVQFVPFSKYQDNPNQLMMEVLAELPTQIVEYYRYKNLNPIKIKNLLQKIPEISDNNNKINNINNTIPILNNNSRPLIPQRTVSIPLSSPFDNNF